MNASRVNRQRRLASPRSSRRTAALLGSVVGVLALVAGAADLKAQDTPAPISLFPPTVSTPQPEQSPDETAPLSAAPAEPSSELSPREGIQVNRLGELDVESLGILDLENGGLGPKVWTGSDGRLIEALVRGLPSDMGSPTLRDLTLRLLLSSAQAPKPAPALVSAPTMADAIAASQTASFLRLRAERLYAMGELDRLNELLSLVPQRVEDPWLAQARVDGLLLAGRDDAACSQVPGGLARYPQQLYWAKALVFCQFVAGQVDQALLGLDLLREQAPESDPSFFALADIMIVQGGGVDAIDGAALTPLTLAMLRQSGATPPADLSATAAPLLLHGVAELPGDNPGLKVGAVERLVQMGALPGARLTAAYADFDFTEPELTDALGEAERNAGVRGRALLYRAADRETLATARAEILRAALLAAEEAGLAHAMAQATLPVVAELAPALELAWFAPLAVRSLYRVGQFERANAWLSVLRIDSLKHPESQGAYAALGPFMRLAGGSDPLSVAPAGLEDQQAADRQLLLFVLSRALGQEETLPTAELTQWGGAASRSLGGLPSLLALGDAAAAGRQGETVLLGATALGDTALADSHPLALGYTVSALSAVGLGQEARSLAIEAALAAGL